MNWTLEDFYAGNKVAIEYDGNLKGLRRLFKDNNLKGNWKYWWFSINANKGVNDYLPDIPIAPLSYFISLLDAQEAAQKAAKEPEYIYEPFSEEAANNGIQVVTATHKIEVGFIKFHKGKVCILMDDELQIWPAHEFNIRRTIETKEVECYVYERPDGKIKICDFKIPAWRLISTFTHTIKIPSK